ncbi:MAG: right-handed parallel beta-helix repeat-containing protein [Candidatus Aenigmarchaeota archaeon]|nr:right-handed parallel beta-helix repeat-containing protein [Candidatus Aenigmarchaeota archaeon]
MAKVNRLHLVVFISFTAILLISIALTSKAAPIEECQNITTPGVYTLNNDVNNDSTCFFINTSHVIFDCQGHVINGSNAESTYGILVENSTPGHLMNITIANCIAKGWYDGIKFNYVNDSIIINSTSHNNTEYGISLFRSSFNNLTGIKAFHNEDTGVYLENSSYNNLTDISAYYNDWNVYLYGYSYRNTIRDINASYPGTDSIVFQRGINNLLRDSILSWANASTGTSGIFLYNDASLNTITNNTIIYNSVGIYVQDAATFGPNMIYDNFLNSSEDNFLFLPASKNYWNTMLDCSAGPSIAGGPCIGGNYWGMTDGTGYSDSPETCQDDDGNGICDSEYHLGGGGPNSNDDVLPLAPEDIILPNVTLDLPYNGSTVGTEAVTFNCTAMDNRALLNVTLWGNLSGEWAANETKSISGKVNTTTFSKTLNEGTYEWNCFACDTYHNCNWSANNFTFYLNTTLTTIVLVYPTNRTAISSASAIDFKFNVTGLAQISNCTLLLDGSKYQSNQSSISKSLTNKINATLPKGIYSWAMNCSDGDNAETGSYTQEITVYNGIMPTLTKYTGKDINYGIIDYGNVSGFWLENASAGRIEWIGKVNISGQDFDANVFIGHNLAGANPANLNSTLNDTVNLTLTSLPYLSSPLIYSDGAICSDCTIQSYGSGTLLFQAEGFSNYTTGSNSNMTIWDETDPGMPYGGKTVRANESLHFFANFTNTTSNESISEWDVYCNISFNATPFGPFDMTYNQSGCIYYFDRSFTSAGLYSWSVECNGSSQGYDVLNASDTVQISAGMSVTNCTNITAPGVYSLNAGIYDWDKGTCFTINVSDVTLDCSGHSIRGSSEPGTYGIIANSSEGSEFINITIMNCNISKWDSGVYFRYVNDSAILNSTGQNNTYGFYIRSGFNNSITGSNATSNDEHGIYIYYSFNNSITGSNASSNGFDGIHLFWSHLNAISNNTANSNSQEGIELNFFSDSNTIMNNTLTSNTKSGIYLDQNDSFNTIEGNTIESNSAYGLRLYNGSHNNTIKGNTIDSNIYDGISLYTQSYSNTITENYIHSNLFYGIYFERAIQNSIVSNNSIWNCSTGGSHACIRIGESDYNVFDSNQVNKSSNYGIWISSSGTGDHCSHNLFRDTNMTNIDGTGVVMTDDSGSSNFNNTFLNFTYANETVNLNSTLIRRWHYRAYVNDSAGNGITGAAVSAYNGSGALIESLTTASDGWTPTGSLIEYINSGGTNHYYSTSNYTVYANKSGYVNASETHNVSLELNIMNDYFQLIGSLPGDIDNCTNITSPGVYSLNAGIHDWDKGTCFTINVSHVTLDCEGHDVQGNLEQGTYGILANSSTGTDLTNITIINCNFSLWDRGLYLRHVNNSVIMNTTSMNNTVHGVSVENCSFINLTGITASKNVLIGIALSSGSYKNTITNTTANENVFAISISSSTNNTIENVTSCCNDFGVYLSSNADGTIINKGNIYSNIDTGIYLSSMKRSTINDNRIWNNSQFGLFLSSSGGSPGQNIIYNNFFNNTNNTQIGGTILSNHFNTTLNCTAGPNILNGSCMGGNFWASPDGSGHSQTCLDMHGDGICDTWLNLTSGNVDFLPLTDVFPAPDIMFVYPAPDNGSKVSGTGILMNVTANSSASNISLIMDFDDSLINWWRFDDVNQTGEGALVIDYMNNDNGTAKGNASQTDAGRMGKGFDFDGDGDYVHVDAFAGNNSLEGTYAFWLYYRNYRNLNVFLVGDNDHLNPVIADSSGSMRIRIYNTTNDGCTLDVSCPSIPIDTWVFYVFTYDSTRGVIYRDGTFCAEDTDVIPPFISTAELFIGSDGVMPDRYINGTMDDVLVFNRSLSSEEVLALYANQSSRYLTREFTQLAEGQHRFKGYVQDMGGNVNSTETRFVTLDATSPAVALVHPPEGYIWATSSTVNFTFNVTDTNNVTNCTLIIQETSNATLQNVSVLNALPTACDNPYSWNNGTHIFGICGTENWTHNPAETDVPTNYTFIYDIASNTVSQGPTKTWPMDREGCARINVTTFACGGGTNGSYTNKTYFIDFANNISWAAGAELPDEIYNVHACSNGTYVWFMGGRNSTAGAGGGQNSIWRWDLSDGEVIDTGNELPSSDYSYSLLIDVGPADERCFLINGKNSSDNFDTIVLFNKTSQTASIVANSPHGSYGAAGVLVGDWVYYQMGLFNWTSGPIWDLNASRFNINTYTVQNISGDFGKVVTDAQVWDDINKQVISIGGTVDLGWVSADIRKLGVYGIIENTTTSVLKNINQTFRQAMGNGDYYWEVSCMDDYGNRGESEGWNISVAFSPPSNVTDCMNITSPGVYYLNNSVSSEVTCFNITSSDVTFDCQGHEIVGSKFLNSRGIQVEGLSGNHLRNLTIANCHAKNWYTGFHIHYVDFSYILNCSTYNNTECGIQFQTSSNNTVIDAVSHDQSNGIEIKDFSHDNKLDGITVWENSNGIYVKLNCHRNSLTGINATHSSIGIFVDSNFDTNITNSTVSYNNYGIRLYSSHRGRITNNTITNNSASGFFISNEAGWAGPNNIFENFLNNTNNALLVGLTAINNWNTTLDCFGSGKNIMGGPCLGGNFWAHPNGTGFSENCSSQTNGICDYGLSLNENNTDFLPIVLSWSSAEWDYWNLTNHTSGGPLGNGLSFTRDQALNASAHWILQDGPEEAKVRHNGTGDFEDYYIPGPYAGNWTNYTLNLSDTGEFVRGGQIEVKHIYVLAGLNSNQTSPSAWFFLWANASVASASIDHDVILNGTSNRMICYVADSHSSAALIGYNVSFFMNDTYIGSNMTDSDGRAAFSFNDGTDGEAWYVVKCNITDQPSLYYNASAQNELEENMTVIEFAIDASASDSQPDYGDLIILSANVTTDLQSEVDSVWAEINYSNHTADVSDSMKLSNSSYTDADGCRYWNFTNSSLLPSRSGSHAVRMFANLSLDGRVVHSDISFDVGFGKISAHFIHQNYRILVNQSFNYSVEVTASDGDVLDLNLTLNSTGGSVINVSGVLPPKSVEYMLNGSTHSFGWDVLTSSGGITRLALEAVPGNGTNTTGMMSHEVVLPVAFASPESASVETNVVLNAYVAGNVSDVSSVSAWFKREFAGYIEEVGLEMNGSANESYCFGAAGSGNVASMSQGSYADCTLTDCNLSINEDFDDYWTGVGGSGEQWLEIIMNKTSTINMVNLLWSRAAGFGDPNVSVFYKETDAGAWVPVMQNISAPEGAKSWDNLSGFVPFKAKRIKVNFSEGGIIKIYELQALTPSGIQGLCYLYSGDFANTNMSGNHSITAHASTGAGNSSSEESMLFLEYGTLSVTAYVWALINGTSYTYHVARVSVLGGDARNVSVNMSLGNSSLVNISSMNPLTYDSLKCYGCNYSAPSSYKDVYYTLGAINLGATVSMIDANSTTGRGMNGTGSASLQVILSDPYPPEIQGFHFQHGCTGEKAHIRYANMYYDACGWLEVVENLTGIKEANASLTFPDGSTYGSLGMTKFNESGNVSWWTLDLGNVLPLSMMGEYNISFFASDYGGKNTTSNTTKNFNNTLNVTDEYTVNLTNNHSMYNRGENLVFFALDVNNHTVASLNWTVNVTIEGVQNFTNGTVNPYEYAAGPDLEGAVSIELNVSGNDNSGYARLDFGVSSAVYPYFISPSSGSEFTASSVIYSNVSIRNERSETLGHICTLNLTCPNAVLSMSGGPPDTYLDISGSCKAHSSAGQSFTLGLSATDAFNNSGTGLVTLSTKSEGNGGNGDTGTGSPGSGIGIAPMVNCSNLCTGWLDVACGLGNCTSEQVYQKRDCQVTTGVCPAERCVYSDQCLEKLGFDFHLSEYEATIKQGEDHKVRVSANNTGNVRTIISIVTESGCSEVSLQDALELEAGDSADLFMNMHVPLSQAIGECEVNVTFMSGISRRTKALKATVSENELIRELQDNENALAEIERQMLDLVSSGIDVSVLSGLKSSAAQLGANARTDITSDDIDSLRVDVRNMANFIAEMNSAIPMLLIYKFLLDNRYILALIIIMTTIITYLVTQVLLPSSRLGKEITGLIKHEKELIQTRVNTEKQYFRRQIDEATFNKILVKKQEEILKTRALMTSKKKERGIIITKGLSPGAMLSWLASGPKRLARRKKPKTETRKDSGRSMVKE